MRAEVFVFLAAALLCCVGLFMPVGQVDIAGRSRLASPATISLFKLGRSDAEVRGFLKGYRESVTAKLGGKALAKVAPHLRGRARSDADDVQEAMAVLDAVKDEDVKLVGNIAAAVVWSLLAFNLLGAYLIIGAHPRGGRGRGRAIAALVTSLLAAVIAIAVHLVLRRVVAEANYELEHELFSLRAGAWVVPIFAVAAFAAAVATLIAFARHRLPPPPAAMQR